MLKLLKFSAFLGILAVTAQVAKANVKADADSLSDLTVKIKVTEEEFSGSSLSLFDTDDCSAFAIQNDQGINVFGSGYSYENGYDYDFPGFPQFPPRKEKPKKVENKKQQDPKKQTPRKPSDKGSESDLTELAEDIGALDEVLTAIEKIGTRVWKLIESNRPVVHTESKVANALPKNVSCWMDLESWKVPKVYRYNVAYTNLFGVDVVNFTFRVVYSYGGSYEGHGKYLANVSVHPAELDVLWGYTFNSKVEVQRLLNLGTKQDPVAGMEMKLSWQISTPIKDSQQTKIFFVTGNGEVTQD